MLCLESLGWATGDFGVDQAVDGLRILYSLESEGGLELLDDVQWADWDRKGQLLVATRAGKLQVRDLKHPSRRLFLVVRWAQAVAFSLSAAFTGVT